VITDAWTGIEAFFEPGREILVASSAEEIVRYLRDIGSDEAAQIGEAMRMRALRDHTYAQRAAQVSALLESAGSRKSAVA
jgi:spore maturation protein CgeB